MAGKRRCFQRDVDVLPGKLLGIAYGEHLEDVAANLDAIVGGLDYRYAIRGETGGSAKYDVREIVNEALERLNEIVSENTPDGMNVETIVRHGPVYEQILQVADDIGADQIVIGAHRPEISDYLLGPNTARVVRHAKCSVNVIRL